jgi:nitrite reductase/ring-hydroxylating ferredoxin subunit
VGAIEDFAVGRPQAFTFGRRSVAVVRLADSEVQAFTNNCPHQGAPLCYGKVTGTMLPSEPGALQYGLRDQVIRCPLHGWEFHVRTGESLFGTTRRRLKKYEARIEDGEVFVLLSNNASGDEEIDA